MRFDLEVEGLLLPEVTGPVILVRDPVEDNEAVTKQYVDSTASLYINTTGDTMTGPLSLASSSPNYDMSAVTKGYVDAAMTGNDGTISVILNQYLNRSGGTISGYLTLSRNPVNTLEAVTKGYLDSIISSINSEYTSIISTKLSKAGGTMTGHLTLPGNPSSSAHAATKQYTDSKIGIKADKSYVDSELNQRTDVALKGAPNGVATLDISGKVPASQLPSFVDDIVEVNTASDLPGSGSSGTIYVAKDTGATYRWTGDSYVEISPIKNIADFANKLLTPVSITINGVTRSFDGTSNISWSLFELNMVTDDQLNVPNGYATLSSTGKLRPEQFSFEEVSLVGPKTVFGGTSSTYTITNIDAFSTYSITTSGGSITGINLENGTFNFLSPPTGGVQTITVTRNGIGYNFNITVNGSYVKTPSITSPTNNQTGVSLYPTFTSSAFAYVGGAQSHVSSHWQVSTNSSFTNIVADSGETVTNLTSWSHTLPFNINTVYYVRVRHKGSLTGWSAWSSPVSFVTIARNGNLMTFNNLSNRACLGNFVIYSYSNYLPDYHFIIAGNTYDGFILTTDMRPLIAKCDTQGNVIWARRGLKVNDGSDLIYGVEKVDAGTSKFYSFAGSESSNSYSVLDANASRPCIFILDENGTVSWGKLVETPTNKASKFIDAKIAKNANFPASGRLVALGYIQDFSVFAIMFDPVSKSYYHLGSILIPSTLPDPVALGTNRLTRMASTSEYIAIGFKPDSAGKSRILIYDFINSKVYREILFHTKGEEEIKAMEITHEGSDWYLYVETTTWNNNLIPNPVHGELIKFRISTGTVVWAKEIRSSLIGSGVIRNFQNNKMAVFPSDDIIVVSYTVKQSATSTNSYMVTIAFDLNGNKKYDYVVKNNSTVSSLFLNFYSLGADYIWYNGGRIVSGFIDTIESSSQNEYIILEKENNNIISEGPVPNKPILETYSDEMTVTNATVTITINTTNTSYLVSNISYTVSNYNPNLVDYGSSFVNSTIDRV